ncbi:hypothetical protein D2T31_00475 [Sinirhodobacter populi]|uniref:Uncharacterized protein n=1 Tax=Paenirhodobacter populi TaxID=2306993 RepID=A0A443KI88_9RHOB|nr:hypothetical protein [Sinirhodobacter populi]RWR32492.1 hypothetical protein D2T31_00475 [Sinirhodobacter populi]
MSDKQQVGRIALRVEGNFWNAYYALPDTMNDAVLIGSIGMAFIVNNPDRKQAFMAMMRECVGDALSARGLSVSHWKDPVSAPEHEKAGRS